MSKTIDELKSEIKELKEELELKERNITDLIISETYGSDEIQSLKEELEKYQKVINSIEFLEALAQIEHEQWIEWATTLMEKENLSSERIQRWKTLLIDYPNLPTEHKESDRKYARIIIKKLIEELQK